MATALDGHNVTKESATICKVEGTVWWLIIAERISWAWLGLPGTSPAIQMGAVTAAMSMVASSAREGNPLVLNRDAGLTIYAS